MIKSREFGSVVRRVVAMRSSGSARRLLALVSLFGMATIWGEGGVLAFSFVQNSVQRHEYRQYGRMMVLSQSLQQQERQATVTELAPPAFGLYEIQEQLLVDRGAHEEKLMAHTYSPLLAAKKPKVRGVGNGGGFASSSARSNNDKTGKFKAEGKSYASVLKSQGVVRIDNVISDNVADELRDFVFALRHKSELDVQEGTIPRVHRFANVLLKTNRCDLTLPLGPDIITKALHDIVLQSPVRHTLEALLGPDAILYEFSCLISDPGSQRQVVHPDTPMQDMAAETSEPVLYTCFIALQDITDDMGPTVWLPGTHNKAAHQTFRDENSMNGKESAKDTLLRTTASVRGTLPKGSCGIFDSRLLHCGGANQSKSSSRALLYVSFKNPKIGYPGNPASIRPELSSKLTLKVLGEELASHQKGNGTPRLDALAATLK